MKQHKEWLNQEFRPPTINIGIKKNITISENNNPPIVPIARENQNTSREPCNKKGIKPNIVETIVNKIGLILC